MAEQTNISWTDATFNPWIGCTRVSPGCDRCYAARDNERRKWVSAWGAERKRTKTWGDPLRWNKKAKAEGVRRRVFCASLADVFDNQVPDEWRADLWELIARCDSLDWLLLTKRPQNIAKMLPAIRSDPMRFGTWPWRHVWLGTTAENQVEYDRRWPYLASVNASVRFLSCEPLLGPIVLDSRGPTVDWIITGGESGPGHRHIDPDWVRSLRDQCAAADIAFHHKQWSGNRPKQNGCLVDGVEHKHFPPQSADLAQLL